MKKVFLSIFLYSFYSLSAIDYSPELNEAMDCIYLLPEAVKLIDEVESLGGPIHVVYTHEMGAPFEGMWQSHLRRISVNAWMKPSLGRQIQTILFELTNAEADAAHRELSRKSLERTISRQDYIQGVEWIEHQNALKTKKLIIEGIEQGIFPKDAFWHVPEDFNQHLAMQQASHHSEWLGKQWDHDHSTCVPSPCNRHTKPTKNTSSWFTKLSRLFFS